MARDRCLVDFPGIEAPIAATYTLSHGTDAGRIFIRCNPQRNKVFEDGPVTLGFDNVTLTIPNCRIVADRITLNGDGFVTAVDLEDYRWKWRYATSDGEFNVRNAYQSVYSPSKRSARRLAELLALDLGIPSNRFNASVLPEDDFPYVQWYGSSTADELNRLVERYGCRVCPWPDGTVNIYKLGEGPPLPTNYSIATDSAGVVSPLGPDKITVAFSPTKYRVIAELEPVGLETDGTIKRIDDLSYRPSTGWTHEHGGNHEDPGSFWKLQEYLVAKYGAATARRGKFAFIMDLARRSIFKWYQIKLRMPRGDAFEIPGCSFGKSITSLSQLLPIDDRLTNVSIDPEKPAEIKDGSLPTDIFWDAYDLTTVWGTYLKKSMNGLDPKMPDFNAHLKQEGETFYNPGGYSIDRERGIVQFDDYVTSLANAGGGNFGAIRFPNLYISFMCSPRRDATREMDRYEVTRARLDIQTKSGTEQVILHPEWQLVRTFDLTTSGKPGAVRDVNRKLLDKVGNYYIDAELRKYRKQNPRTINYNGIVPIYTSGAIREVTFSVSGEGGADTIACYNDERQPNVIPYEQRRRNQRVAAGLKTSEFVPPVFTLQPQTFPYNLGSTFVNANPSRR